MIHKYLAYLKTIETGSITQAAAELGYTQSAVSRMIADLEEHWDVPLLTRNRSGIEISSEGTQLLPILQSIVKGQEELSFAVGELHGLQNGLIRVGAFTSMATGWMPLMIKSFHEKYPNIRFQIFNGEYNQIATWLRRGQIDCGFLALPCAKEFDTTFLLRDSLTVILPPNHPLRDAECFPVSRLSDEDFISLKEEQDYEINLFLEHLRQSPRIKFEVSSDFAILAMVECGLGISVVHDLILHPNRHGIIKKPLDEPYYRDIAIATSAAAQPSTITRMSTRSSGRGIPAPPSPPPRRRPRSTRSWQSKEMGKRDRSLRKRTVPFAVKAALCSFSGQRPRFFACFPPGRKISC